MKEIFFRTENKLFFYRDVSLFFVVPIAEFSVLYASSVLNGLTHLSSWINPYASVLSTFGKITVQTNAVETN